MLKKNGFDGLCYKSTTVNAVVSIISVSPKGMLLSKREFLKLVSTNFGYFAFATNTNLNTIVVLAMPKNISFKNVWINQLHESSMSSCVHNFAFQV